MDILAASRRLPNDHNFDIIQIDDPPTPKEPHVVIDDSDDDAISIDSVSSDGTLLFSPSHLSDAIPSNPTSPDSPESQNSRDPRDSGLAPSSPTVSTLSDDFVVLPEQAGLELLLRSLPSDPRPHTEFRQLLQYLTIPEKHLTLFPGMDVELADGVTFSKIKHIVSERSRGGVSTVSLVGHIYRLSGTLPDHPSLVQLLDHEDMAQCFPALPNEVIWITHILEDSELPLETRYLMRIAPADVESVTTIKMTNCPYPKYNSFVEEECYKRNENPMDHSLVCRVRASRSWPSDKRRRMNKSNVMRPCKKKIEWLTEEEADEGLGMPDAQLMKNCLGRCSPGGSNIGVHHDERKRWEYEAARESELVQETGLLEDRPSAHRHLDDPRDELSLKHYSIEADVENVEDLPQGSRTDAFWKQTTRNCRGEWHGRRRRYTFGDFFCGMGGASRAATDAGMYVEFGNDIDESMCHTWHRNNPGSRVACRDCFRFVYDTSGLLVDIVHISNPCQPFSKSHTTPGRNDDRNAACIHLVEEIIRRCRPRVVTLENADGLYVKQECREYFNMLLRQFISHGYNVQAEVIPLADYGAAQARHRLIVIATCPGQKLPGLPAPTHCKHGSGGLLAWRTVNQAISNIPTRWVDHEPEHMPIHLPEETPSIVNGNAPGPTLLTNNGLNHPDGYRKMTIRELASLQGFPLWHEFGDGQPNTKKEQQVGNAVPPVAFQKIFAHIRDFLLQCDGFQPGECVFADETRINGSGVTDLPSVDVDNTETAEMVDLEEQLREVARDMEGDGDSMMDGVIVID